MEQSLFVKYVLFFTAIVAGITERINGKKTAATYLYKDMLTKQISTDLKWSSLNVSTYTVTADIVAMDTALPKKRRDAFGKASGTIPKIGMRMDLNEKTMSEIDVLKSRGGQEAIIVDKIFADTAHCLVGVHEKIEYLFLQALSEGMCLIDDDTNVGVGIIADFGYLDGNKFGVSAPWSNPTTSKPYDDIQNVLDYADTRGDSPTYFLMDKVTFNNFSNSDQIKQKFAFSIGFVGTQIQQPNLEQTNKLMASNMNAEIIIINRKFNTERDGIRTSRTPWATNRVIMVPSLNVGDLQYGILAEATRPNKAVMYETAEGFILVKKWHENEPFAEMTSAQCIALPVINSVDSIYMLNTEEADLSVQTEGDANYSYKGVNYTKVSVIAGLNAASPGQTLTTASTDAAIQKAVNKLSDEQILIFEANIVAA